MKVNGGFCHVNKIQCFDMAITSHDPKEEKNHSTNLSVYTLIGRQSNVLRNNCYLPWHFDNRLFAVANGVHLPLAYFTMNTSSLTKYFEMLLNYRIQIGVLEKSFCPKPRFSLKIKLSDDLDARRVCKDNFTRRSFLQNVDFFQND